MLEHVSALKPLRRDHRTIGRCVPSHLLPLVVHHVPLDVVAPDGAPWAQDRIVLPAPPPRKCSAQAGLAQAW